MPALNNIGFESLPITNTAGGLQSIPTAAQSFVGVLETADIRVRIDGNAPTTSTGRLIRAEETVLLKSRGELTQASFIRDGSTSATVQGHYYDKPIQAGFVMQV